MKYKIKLVAFGSLFKTLFICYCRLCFGLWHASVKGLSSFHHVQSSPMEPSNDVALDIIITNVVSVFRTRCHLNLRTIGLEGTNVIYKPEVGVCLDIQSFEDYSYLFGIIIHYLSWMHFRFRRLSISALCVAWNDQCMWPIIKAHLCSADVFYFSESPDEASKATYHCHYMVVRENHLHWSDKVSTLFLILMTGSTDKRLCCFLVLRRLRYLNELVNWMRFCLVRRRPNWVLDGWPAVCRKLDSRWLNKFITTLWFCTYKT